MKDCGNYEVLGRTRDDAAGEAFDKVARLLHLGYPGGPEIDRVAKTGDSGKFALPEGKIGLPEGGYHPYDSSFSGLKTAVLRLVEKLQQQVLSSNGDIDSNGNGDLPVEDIAASFQETVARALTKRAIACARDFNLKTIVVGGGVAANSCLRKHLKAAAAHGFTVYFPPLKLCTDNAAMIGCAAADHFNRGHRSALTLGVKSRMSVTDVMELY